MVGDLNFASKPITLVSTEKLEDVIPGISPCALTPAMGIKNQNILNNLQMIRCPVGYYVTNGALI